jgi:formylglycine-generating enzyme required for sulfatase activity
MWRVLLRACLFASITLASGASAGMDAQPRAEPSATSSARAPSIAPRRVALVIGNGAYPDRPLANPAHDADAMSDALRALGFDVTRIRNATRQQMLDALDAFDRRLAAGGTGLVYFAGHGASVRGSTWLAPVDADVRTPGDLTRTGVDLQTVLDAMSRPRKDRINLIILDACLSAPSDAAAIPIASLPIAALPIAALPIAAIPIAAMPVDAMSVDAMSVEKLPAQTLVGYATAPGAYAADGVRHGIYTAALLRTLASPGLDIADLFEHAGEIVGKATRHRQTPWFASSLTAAETALPFTSATRLPGVATRSGGHDATRAEERDAISVVTLASRGVMPKDSTEQYEITFWESIKDSQYASDYEAYLKAYPNGRFVPLAQARLARLRAAAPKPAVVAPAAAPAPAPAAAAAAAAAAAPAPSPPPTPASAHPLTAAHPSTAAKPPAAAAVAAPPPPAKPVTAAINELHDCAACPVMLAVNAGTFTMGNDASDPSERPAHRVTLGHGFALSKYAVTVAQWNACRDAGACPRLPSDSNNAPNAPVRDLSWDDAQQYAAWLSKISGKPYRLPTEAEWEYAARGGTATRYWWGNEMRTGTANCKDCGQPWHADAPDNVGSFAANPFGFYDMGGSVWEWVSDCWHESYKSAPADGHAWDEPNCQVRVIRGGSWRDGASYMPASTRFKYDSSVRYSANGFRVGRDMK